MGILSFGNRATKRFARGDRRRLPPEHASKIDYLLRLLDRGTCPEDLRVAGVRIQRLVGDRKGYSAIEVSPSLRIVFRFRDGNAYDSEVVDYHRS